jgi:hypothetical protein
MIEVTMRNIGRGVGLYWPMSLSCLILMDSEEVSELIIRRHSAKINNRLLSSMRSEICENSPTIELQVTGADL